MTNQPPGQLDTFELAAPEPPAPTPPIGPSTLANLTTLIAGLIVSGLALSGTVVDDATTAHISIVVGGLLTLASLGWMTWSRTRQAQDLARNAQTIAETRAFAGVNAADAPDRDDRDLMAEALDGIALVRKQVARLRADLDSPKGVDRIREAYADGDTGARPDAYDPDRPTAFKPGLGLPATVGDVSGEIDVHAVEGQPRDLRLEMPAGSPRPGSVQLVDVSKDTAPSGSIAAHEEAYRLDGGEDDRPTP